MTAAPRLVLASRSAIRQKMLTDAGLSFVVDAADVDEDAIGAATDDPAQRARRLALAKAERVAGRQPQDSVVIAADQVGVLRLDDTRRVFLDKPRDPADHLRLLTSMAGRTHEFFPTAVVRRGADIVVVEERVAVTFRPFSAREAQAYVDAGEGRGSCGGYESENRGAQLIARIEGSAHAVMGLPLLGVLEALRRFDVRDVGLLCL